jgi:beta-glucanase (GH16 family)
MSFNMPMRARLHVLLLVAGAAIWFLTCAPTATAATVMPNGNRITNPSFESSASGWNHWQSALTRISDSAPDGTHVAQVTRGSGTSYSLDNAPSATKSVASGTYVATAWVKAGSTSATGKPVYIAIRETTPSHTVARETKSATVALTSSYQAISTTASVAHAGDTLQVYVLQSKAVSGDSFRVDAISLSSITSWGFEDGSTDGWTAATGGGPVSNTTSHHYSGSRSAQLYLPGTGNAAFRSPQYPTGIVPGAQVTYRVYAPAGSWMSVTPYVVDGSWTYHYMTATPVISAGWRTITWTVPALSGGARYIGLQFLNGQAWKGYMYLDAVSSTAVKRPAAAPANNPNPTVAPSTTPKPVGVSGTWTAKFDDEFSGTSLASKWATCFPWGCAGNYSSEYQCYGASNVLEGSNMVRLEASVKASRCSNVNQPYTSGLISSYPSYHFQYGYVEERFKLPTGKGYWPALELLAANQVWPPEIDAFEGNGAATTQVGMHYHYSTAANAPGWTFAGPDFTKGFHTVGVDVEPGGISWYVDGQFWCSYTDLNGLKPITSQWYIVAPFAIGGPSRGKPDSTTPFPAYYDIDYIRAWQH